MKIAAIATAFFKYSHTQHIVDRFLEGYGWAGKHHHPEMDLVSLYMDQIHEKDLSKSRGEEFPSMKLCESIGDALTLGTDSLAVDGVLLIGEHGEYGQNDMKQYLYPRHELFMKIVEVYEQTGKTAPIFNDKHISWNWDWAVEMVETSKRLDFAFMAGSSLPVTWRIPSIEMPLGAEIEEAVSVCFGGPDSYDFHGLETLQCMVERRKGGECGVKNLQSFKGDAFWKAHHEQVWSRELFDANLCRSHKFTPARAGFNQIFPNHDELKKMCAEPIAYHYEHNDGLKCTMILLNGIVQDFNFAARLKGREDPLSTQMYLQMPGSASLTLANFFSPLMNNVEKMFQTGKPTWPIERNLLTTGLTAAGVKSLHLEGELIETPHLKIAYDPPQESHYWRY
jgi:hypothetical protein